MRGNLELIRRPFHVSLGAERLMVQCHLTADCQRFKMGYDLTVLKGHVRLAEAEILIRELLEFAAQMELEVIPVNWMVSGIIPDHNRLLLEIFEEEKGEADHFVSRPVIKKTTERGKELPWYAIDREHVQGLVFCHHYEEWILTWNVSRGGLLGQYCQLPGRPVERFFDQRQAVAPKSLLASLDDFINSNPVEIDGEISEGHINIHCPWRRSDAAAACDAVKLLARHSDGLEARDDMGVWPDKEFTKWVNFANKWAQAVGGSPVHPDPTDDLLSGERDQGESDDKD
jgi:hypothetical protein